MGKQIKQKGTWGGKRERKNKKEPTKVMRIPVSKVQDVRNLIGKK